jgi:hypothetical protein
MQQEQTLMRNMEMLGMVMDYSESQKYNEPADVYERTMAHQRKKEALIAQK